MVGIFCFRKMRNGDDYVVKCRCPYNDCGFQVCETYFNNRTEALKQRNYFNTKWRQNYKFSDVVKSFMSDNEINDYIQNNKHKDKITFYNDLKEINNNELINN